MAEFQTLSYIFLLIISLKKVKQATKLVNRRRKSTSAMHNHKLETFGFIYRMKFTNYLNSKSVPILNNLQPYKMKTEGDYLKPIFLKFTSSPYTCDV